MHGAINMKYIFPFFALLFAVTSCTDSTSSKSGSEEVDESNVTGWVSAGFTPNEASLSTDGSGLQLVTHSGDWILLEDAWTSPVEGKPGKYTYTPRLFVSKIGSADWDTLTIPSEGFVKTVFADSLGFYVGTTKTGDVLKYLPDEHRWEKIDVLDSNDGVEYTVYGISKIDENLIVSLAGFKDTLTKEVVSQIRLQNGNSWISLETPPIYYDAYLTEVVPLQFHKGVVVDGLFYAATMDGVWILDPNSKKWTQMPKPPKVKHTEQYVSVPVQSITIYKGNVVISDSRAGLVYEWNSSSEEWVRLDSLHYSYYYEPSMAGQYRVSVNTPDALRSFATDGNHLFVSGQYQSCPMVYMGDYGEPYGNISQGWRCIAKGWVGKYWSLSTMGVYGLDIIDGFLYAAAYEGLYKLDLRELDSAIYGEDDYVGI